MDKDCKKCGETKDATEFHLADSKTGRRRNQCKACQAKYISAYKNADPEAMRDRWRKASRKYYKTENRRNKTLRQYGLDESTYNKMYDSQNGECAICHRSITLVVDHCHTKGVVRGLLCNMCNVALGCMQDDVDRLRAAVLYLELAGGRLDI
jgi:hypothetical protein